MITSGEAATSNGETQKAAHLVDKGFKGDIICWAKKFTSRFVLSSILSRSASPCRRWHRARQCALHNQGSQQQIAGDPPPLEAHNLWLSRRLTPSRRPRDPFVADSPLEEA